MRMKKLLKSLLLIFFSVDLLLLTTLAPAMDAYAITSDIRKEIYEMPDYQRISGLKHTQNLDSLLDRSGMSSKATETIKDVYNSMPGWARNTVDKGIGIVGEGISKVKKEIEGKIEGKAKDSLKSLGITAYGMGKSFMNGGKNLIQQGTKLAKKSVTAIDTANKAKPLINTSKGARQLYFSAMKQSKKFAQDSAAKLSAGKLLRGSGAVLKVAGGVLNAVNMMDDAKELLAETKNKRAPLAAIERGLTWADLLLGAGALILFVGGAPVTGAVATATIVIGGAKTFITSDGFTDWANDPDNELLNGLDELVNSIGGARKTPTGVGALKPNIYIYNADGKLISVQFAEPGLLTKAIPDYSGGWSVIASGDDSILVTEDGCEYGFLFYESMTEKNMFDTLEGFKISADNRVAKWHGILSEYGFNEREIDDFIEFWDVKLEKVDYIMYPQFNDKVDAAMPIIIDPEPENIIRMWFAFATDKGQENKEPEIVSFTHDGYTAVEWGGMIFD